MQSTSEQSTVTVPSVTSPCDPLVPTRVRGVVAHVPCPSWCVIDHTAENLVDLADLVHYGAELPLLLPSASGGEEAVASVRLAAWPWDSDPEERNPHLVLTDPSGECVSLPAALAESVARGIEQTAAALRSLAGITA